MSTTLKHIQALNRASIALEDTMRRTGYYAQDAASRGRRQYILTLDEEGGAHISPLARPIAPVNMQEPKRVGGGNRAGEPEESYEQCNRASESYRKGKARHEDQPASDAARISRLSAEARKATADAMIRNRAFAELTKAKSKALWDGQKPGAIRPL